MNELINRVLPKWPQMIVTGEKITEKQALEIIRRTDSFFSYPSGNNHSFIRKAKEAVRYKDTDEYKPDVPYSDKSREYWELREEYRKKWGFIESEYITNSWISCSYIGGVHGWCHPDGAIGYSDNVGKWPSVEEIYNEWVAVAEAFPFLELGVTLMSGEDCEENTFPIVSMKISNGTVQLVDPAQEDVHSSMKSENNPKDKVQSFVRNFYTRSENAISLNILTEWGNKVFGEDNIFVR